MTKRLLLSMAALGAVISFYSASAKANEMTRQEINNKLAQEKLQDSEKLIQSLLGDYYKQQALRKEGQLLDKRMTVERDRRRHGCNDDPADMSEELCWSSCVADNWSMSYCINNCGIKTFSGEEACWNKCTDDNWSMSYCKNNCGVKTGAGVKACWKKCTDDNWSTSYCTNNCK